MVYGEHVGFNSLERNIVERIVRMFPNMASRSGVEDVLVIEESANASRRNFNLLWRIRRKCGADG